MMSYLCENEAENIQNGDGYMYVAQILDFGMGYLKNRLIH